MAVTMTRWENTQATVIGAMMIAPDRIGDVISDTSAEDFSGPGRTVYLAIRSMFLSGSVVDPITVQGMIGEDHKDYMLQCIEITPTVANLSAYLAQLRRMSREAQLRTIAAQIQTADNLETMQDLIRQASETMVTTSRITTWTMQQGFVDLIDRKTKGETYYPTGLSRLDSEIYLSPGDYVVLAGRPSRGKSLLALQMALAQSKNHSVGFYSLETSLPKVMDRIACHASGVGMDAIKKANLDLSQSEELAKASVRLSDPEQCQLLIHHSPGCTVEEIVLNAWRNRHKIIYIDYLQLVRDSHAGKGSERYNTVTNVSMDLHTMAQRYGIVVVALSQLSRESTKAKTEEPSLSDLRESGQIEQDADAVLMLYCERKGDFEGNRVLKIAKNKEGTTGRLSLRFDGAAQRMTAVSNRTPPPLPRLRKLPDTTPVPFEPEQIAMEVTT